MNHRRWLSCLAFALAFVPSLASGDEPSLADRVRQRVDSGLLKPLAQQEDQRFSRARPPPAERRVRILDTTPIVDAAGNTYVAFAVDVRFGTEWHENDIVGCAYPTTGKLFVKRGETYRPSAFLLGKKADPVSGVCEPRRAQS